MKFLHTADSHIGRVNMFRKFSQIMHEAVEKKVDFVIHSGDLFDKRAGTRDVKRVGEFLGKVDIPIYAIAGNHDKPEFMETLDSQGSLKLLQDGEYIQLPNVRIYGLNWLSKDTPRAIRDLIPTIEHDGKTILMLHSGVNHPKTDCGGSERYIGPVTIDRLKGVDYVALGHTHYRFVVENIHNPGSPKPKRGHVLITKPNRFIRTI